MMGRVSEPDADYFSSWYADMGEVPDKDRLWTRLLGLPPHVLSTSALTGPALDEVAGILRLDPGDVLLDLACGRAGYGLELAARSGARLDRARLRRSRDRAGPRQRRPARPRRPRRPARRRHDRDGAAPGIRERGALRGCRAVPSRLRRHVRRGAPGAPSRRGRRLHGVGGAEPAGPRGVGPDPAGRPRHRPAVGGLHRGRRDARARTGWPRSRLPGEPSWRCPRPTTRRCSRCRPRAGARSSAATSTGGCSAWAAGPR